MSDVDDELLALAGGDVSSDEDDGASMNISREESQTPPPPAKTAKGVATKKAPAKKASKRHSRSDGSEEEGEASSAPSSPSSLQSAPMEESDSEGEAPPSKSRNDDENKYPIEGMFMSLAEKAEIMSLGELEREQILAERAQEKDRIHQNKLLRQLVSNEEQRNKKRSASAAELEDGQRKASRARTKAGEKGSALDTLKTRRAEKTERNRRREEDRERRKDRSPSYHNEYADDRDGDSDVEWARPSKSKQKSRTPEIKDIPLAELADIERVRLSRSRFGQVCFYPGFEAAILGCFVRISIGPDPKTGESVYRMASIKGFTKGKAYALTSANGQQIVTDQYCLAAHGKAQREWPFISCSDSHFTEAEWNRYQKVCQAEGVALPKKPSMQNKVEDINKLLQRAWTEQEIAEKVRRTQDLKSNFNGIKRQQLENSLKEAKTLGDEARAAALQEELDNFETQRLAFRTTLTPTKKGGAANSSTPSQQERLARVNAENRKRNTEAVRRAQLKERAQAREIEKKLERGEQVDEDHSRRLKTRAKFVHDVNESHEKKPSSQAGSGASTPANGTPRLGAQKQPLLPHLAKLQQQKAVDKNGLPTIHKPLMDDDIIGALDLDIDENILD